jgi:hypothetical protein
MAYDKTMGLGDLVRKSNAFDTAETLTTAGVHGGYLVTKPCELAEFMFYVTTALTGSAVVEVNQRPSGSAGATGEVLLAQLTIPDGTAVGKVVAKRIEPVQLNIGDELSFEMVTIATAGGGFYDVLLHADMEADGNQSDRITSA